MLSIALIAVIGAGIWGFGVFGKLTEGGYSDPGSESARAADVVAAALDGRGGDVIAIYTPDQGTIDDAALTKRIKDRLAALPDSAVRAQSSYWDKKAAAFAAEDKSSAVAVITLAGADDGEKTEAYDKIEDDLGVPGARLQLAGGIPLGHASSERSTDDLAFAEMISLPIVLILLLFIFGSLVAAALPVIVGGAAVLGSLGVLHAVALTHEVNSFAVNVASLLGLGMAIDYGLFMVGRFREEQAGHSTAEAVRRTVATAGRTVVFSATLLMTALAGLLLFPQGFLKSLAYGGLAAVFLAMLLSLTLLPAILAVLGPRVDKIPVRLPGGKTGSGSGWNRLAGLVLRRPVLFAVPILAGLLLLALPIGGVRFGENDERVLPPGDESRVAIETLKADYPQFSTDGVQIVVRGTADPRAFVKAAGEVPGVAEISPTGKNKDVTVYTAALEDTDSFSTPAREAVDDLRALAPPEGSEVLIGGVTARNVDSLTAIAARLPAMIGLLAGATLLLMFLAFGSLLLPIKAVVMSGLSLTATFGILIWIFQDGHGAGLLDITPAPLEAGIVVLMAAVVFGLSTDYEVFLLSRMVEARAHGASTKEAVTIGLTRTGRVISAAALLLIVVTGAFALSSVTTMRFVGIGMIIALVLDATVVRMLLVPAVLALFGDAAWWAPGPLRRLQERAGLSEHAGEAEISGRQASLPAAALPAVAHADRPDADGLDTDVERTAVLQLPARAAGLDSPELDSPEAESPSVFEAPLESSGDAASPAVAASASDAGESGNTVVLSYAAVLDHLAEKDRPEPPANDVTTVLPVVKAADSPVIAAGDMPVVTAGGTENSSATDTAAVTGEGDAPEMSMPAPAEQAAPADSPAADAADLSGPPSSPSSPSSLSLSSGEAPSASGASSASGVAAPDVPDLGMAAPGTAAPGMAAAGAPAPSMAVPSAAEATGRTGFPAEETDAAESDRRPAAEVLEQPTVAVPVITTSDAIWAEVEATLAAGAEAAKADALAEDPEPLQLVESVQLRTEAVETPSGHETDEPSDETPYAPSAAAEVEPATADVPDAPAEPEPADAEISHTMVEPQPLPVITAHPTGPTKPITAVPAPLPEEFSPLSTDGERTTDGEGTDFAASNVVAASELPDVRTATSNGTDVVTTPSSVDSFSTHIDPVNTDEPTTAAVNIDEVNIDRVNRSASSPDVDKTDALPADVAVVPALASVMPPLQRASADGDLDGGNDGVADAAPDAVTDPAGGTDAAAATATATGRLSGNGPDGREPAQDAVSTPAVVPDPFAWRADPRLANVVAGEPDEFPWLPAASAGPEEAPQTNGSAATAAPTEPSEQRPGQEPVADLAESAAAPGPATEPSVPASDAEPSTPVASEPSVPVAASTPSAPPADTDLSAPPADTDLSTPPAIMVAAVPAPTVSSPALAESFNAATSHAEASTAEAIDADAVTGERVSSDSSESNDRRASEQATPEQATLGNPSAPAPVAPEPSLPAQPGEPRPADRQPAAATAAANPDSVSTDQPGDLATPAAPEPSVAPTSPSGPRPRTLDDWLSGSQQPPTPARPQTLDEWLNGPAGPTPPRTARPETLDEWLSGTVPVSSGAPTHRPQTLDDWLGASKQPPAARPTSLADHPGKPARPAPESDPVTEPEA